MTENEKNAKHYWEEEKMEICEIIANLGYISTNEFWIHIGRIQALKATGTITRKEYEQWEKSLNNAWREEFKVAMWDGK